MPSGGAHHGDRRTGSGIGTGFFYIGVPIRPARSSAHHELAGHITGSLGSGKTATALNAAKLALEAEYEARGGLGLYEKPDEPDTEEREGGEPGGSHA